MAAGALTVRKRVALLGATGSIGASTADVLLRHPGRFEAVALSAHRDVAGLVARCRALRPQRAVIADATLLDALARGLREAGLATEPLAGAAALAAIAADAGVDCVVAAIVGAAGLESTLAAARAGKQLLLANKEAVVMAGPLLAAALATGGGTLLPLDSEHKRGIPVPAAGLCARSRAPWHRTHHPDRLGRAVPRLARRGPGRSHARTSLRASQLAHGAQISVDSATLMNKGLEVIEAHGLFGLAPDRIEVVVHPQSVIHSLVAYRDGSTLAQLGNPDMRTAIAGRAGLAGADRRRGAGAGPDRDAAPGLRSRGRRHLPLPRAGLCCLAGRRRRPHGPECGQRGRC